MAEPSRPLVTFALFAYNQERYIRDAVKGALSQNYSPLEIILSDDLSTDKTYEIMREMAADYSGPHAILLNQNERNLGIGGHLNKVMDLANGEWIVGAAGDDISLPNRTQVLVDHSQQFPSCLSLYSNMMMIDPDGTETECWAQPGIPQKPPDLKEIVRTGRGVFGCTHAWRRELFCYFGPLRIEVVAEDILIPFRALLLGDIHYVDAVLVMYRRHEKNISKGREQMVSAAIWTEYSNLFIDSAIGVSATMIGDLNTLSAKDPKQYSSLSWIFAEIKRNMLASQIEKRLLASSSFFQKIRLIVSGILGRVTPRRIVRWILWQVWSKKYHD